MSATSTINSGVFEQHDFEHSWIFENMHHKEIRAKATRFWDRTAQGILCCTVACEIVNDLSHSYVYTHRLYLGCFTLIKQ